MRSLATQPASNNTAIGFHALQQHHRQRQHGHGVDALRRNTTGNEQHGQRCLMRSVTTQPAATTRPLGYSALVQQHNRQQQHRLGRLAPVSISPRAVTISISATRCCWRVQHHPHRQRQELRRPPLSPALAGQPLPGGVGVIVDTNGHLGTVVSSARFKDAIKPMDKASEAILALKPVTFRYKTGA